MRTDKYIKIKVEGLVNGDKWVHKPVLGNGLLAERRDQGTLFTEEEAFEMRKKIIPQLPKDVKVTFDLTS